MRSKYCRSNPLCRRHPYRGIIAYRRPRVERVTTLPSPSPQEFAERSMRRDLRLGSRATRILQTLRVSLPETLTIAIPDGPLPDERA